MNIKTLTIYKFNFMSQIINKIVTSKYPPATNVAWMDTSSGDPMLKVFRNGTWETVTAEEPDLSNYIQKSSTAGLVKNDGTIDTTNLGTKQDTYYLDTKFLANLPDNTLVCTSNTIYRIREEIQTLSILLPSIPTDFHNPSSFRGDKSIKIYITTSSDEPNITFSSQSPISYDNVTFEASSVYEIICTANDFFWTVKSNKIVVDPDTRWDAQNYYFVTCSPSKVTQGGSAYVSIVCPDGTTPTLVAKINGVALTQTITPISNHEVRITISTEDIPIGRYTVVVDYPGNEFFKPTSKSSSLRIT